MIDTSELTTMLLCIDHDQREPYSRMPDHPRLKIQVGLRADIVGSINTAVKAHPGYDAYGLLVDDARFTVVGWDRWLLGSIDDFPNRLGVISAAHNIGEFVNFAYVSREWVEVVGWYACPDTVHFCWDTVLEMLGEATAIVYAPKEWFHIDHDLSQNDEKVKVFMEDCVRFLDWCVNARRALVFKIRAAMVA